MGSRPFKLIPLVIAAVIMVSGVVGIKLLIKKEGSIASKETPVKPGDGSVVSSANTTQATVTNSKNQKSGGNTVGVVNNQDARLAQGGSAPSSAVVSVTPAPSLGASQEQAVAPAVVVAPVPSCKTITFRHKAVRGHSDAEECSEHKNFVALDMHGVDKKSICLRVDGIAVGFEQEKDGLVFGAVAGPKTPVAVEYCGAGAVRTSECKVTRDQFMDALGGSEKLERSPASAKWNANDNEDDPDAVGELDRELQEEASVAQGLPVFKGWVVEK